MKYHLYNFLFFWFYKLIIYLLLDLDTEIWLVLRPILVVGLCAASLSLKVLNFLTFSFEFFKERKSESPSSTPPPPSNLTFSKNQDTITDLLPTISSHSDFWKQIKNNIIWWYTDMFQNLRKLEKKSFLKLKNWPISLKLSGIE